jgi:hypothetical protein
VGMSKVLSRPSADSFAVGRRQKYINLSAHALVATLVATNLK